MKQASDLTILKEKAVYRAYRLRSLVDKVAPPIGGEIDRTVAFVTIEALNLWASFAREFYLSCVQRAKRESGTRVAVGISGLDTNAAAIAFAASIVRVRKAREPVWHDPKVLLKVLTAAKASNMLQLQAALSYPTTVFTSLPTMRNFFAHRSQGTATKVAKVARAVGVSTKLRPSEVLCTRVGTRPQNVLSDWIDDIRNIIELSCV